MIFLRKKEIISVRTFKVCKDDVLIRDNQNNLFLNGSPIDSDIRSFYFFYNYVMYYKSGNTYIVNGKGERIDSVSGSVNIESIHQDTLLVTEGEKLSLYRINRGFFIDSYSFPHSYAIGENFRKEFQLYHRQGYTHLKSLSLETGEYEWEVDLTEIGTFTDHRGETHEGQIEHILGIWQDTLWVWLKGYQCVGIHTDTGQITHHWFPFQDLFKPGHFFLNFPHFDAHTGQIHFFERSYFIQIDLATQVSQILWQDKAYEINASRVDKDYVYFIGAQPDSVYSTVVGVFDRQANAVVWTDTIDLPPFVTLNQAPVVGADKLYVLDSGGTLRIYQRQA